MTTNVRYVDRDELLAMHYQQELEEEQLAIDSLTAEITEIQESLCIKRRELAALQSALNS